MAKDWPYAKLSEEAKKHGGPEQYVEMLEKYGFQKGIIAMIPVCAGCVWIYANGGKIVQFCKDKLKIVSKRDAKLAKQNLVDGIKEAERVAEEQCELPEEAQNIKEQEIDK
ncbi:hypothetical protein D5274_07035 [bacterium 1XD42-94]|nr:hypothetical protein [bacterium 1XD42-76]NBK04917.1 hypothetical protein [bacterium 1XD42-94]